VEPAVTEEERETAEMYRRALTRFPIGWYEREEIDFSAALFKVPWSTTPTAVTEGLARNAECLALVDAALARGACRFGDTSFQSNLESRRLRELLVARGHAALAAGDYSAAAAEVGRLIRVGRDFAAAPRPGGAEEGWPWPDLQILIAEEDAARLLSAIATAPNLPPEAGPALIAAATQPWGTSDAIRRSIDAHEDSDDARWLILLGPGAEAWLDKMHMQATELQDLLRVVPSNQNLLEKARDRIDRIRRELRPRSPVPKAAEVRTYRTLRDPIVAAERRRDVAALAPGSPFDEAGRTLGLLSPRSFRNKLADEARIAVTRAAAAIRAFQLREGRPPRSLEELVPSVLPEVPLDPFDGKPLLYETEGEGWRVASRIWTGTWKHPGFTDEVLDPVEVRFPLPTK
jgi:hypothetical protein